MTTWKTSCRSQELPVGRRTGLKATSIRHHHLSYAKQLGPDGLWPNAVYFDLFLVSPSGVVVVLDELLAWILLGSLFHLSGNSGRWKSRL